MHGRFQRKKRKITRCMYQRKIEANEQFGRKINQDEIGNRKFILEGSE